MPSPFASLISVALASLLLSDLEAKHGQPQLVLGWGGHQGSPELICRGRQWQPLALVAPGGVSVRQLRMRTLSTTLHLVPLPSWAVIRQAIRGAVRMLTEHRERACPK